jgi:hypothetical protein
MNLSRLMAGLAATVGLLMVTLFTVGLILAESGAVTLGVVAIGAGMVAALPTGMLTVLSVEAHTEGTLS